MAGSQREDVARPGEVVGRAARVHRGLDRSRPVVSGNARADAVANQVDRNGKGGAVRGIVVRHHRREAQPLRGFARQRYADDAAGVPDDERHLFRRGVDGGKDEIALVLAIVVVGNDHELAAREGFDDGVDLVLALEHDSGPCQPAGGVSGQAGASPICPR